MVGDDSVVGMLEAKGWTIEQQRGVTLDRYAGDDEVEAGTEEKVP